MSALDTLAEAGREHRLLLLLGGDRPGEENAPSVRAGALKPWELFSFVEEKLLPAEADLVPLYAAAAALPVHFWLTTTYGPALSQALSDAGREPNVHVSDDDWLERQLNHPDLIRLRGDVQQSGRLVVTPAEYQALPDDERLELYERARQLLAENTVLILGCDPAAGSDFNRLIFPHLLRKPGTFASGGFLVWPDAVPGDVTRWEGRGITVVDADPPAFVQTLATALDGVQAVDPEAETMGALARILMREPRPAQIRATVEQIAEEERARAIHITFTLDLTGDQELASTIDVRYTPDMGIDYDPKDLAPTGLTLTVLQEWARAAEKRRNNGLAPDDTKARALFDRLLPEGSDHRQKYRQALFLASILPAGVTHVFRLAGRQGHLWTVPWELLHDGNVSGLEAGAGGRGFMSLAYPVYRWLPAVTSAEQAAGDLQKALVVAADPRQTLPGLEDEARWLAGQLQERGLQVDLRLPDDPAVAQAPALKQLIQLGAYDLFHFAGHGQFDAFDPLLSALILGGPQAAEDPLPVTALAQAARDTRLKLVVFSACAVGQAGAQDPQRPWEAAGVVTGLLRAGVPAALGMQWNIEDDAGKRLMESFYEALLSGGASVEQSLKLARQALHADDRADWANPILTKKHDMLTGR